MVKTIQIIIILQGLFLVFSLLKNKDKYKKIQLRLLVLSILSVIFYTIVDDNHYLFLKETDWFLLDSSLFITFLFLFILYFNSEKEHFNKLHYLLFIPNILFFAIEMFEFYSKREPLYIEIPEFLIELTFLSYLIFSIYSIVKGKHKKWILLFIIPIIALMSIEFINNVFVYFKLGSSILEESTISYYFLLIVALLFYFMTFYLINSSDNLLLKKATIKYKNSKLSSDQINEYKSSLIHLMEVEKLYIDKKLTIDSVSRQIEIPKQYISEILNVHMHTNFHDFVNGYRVKAFIHCIKNKQFEQYSLLGIAYEVGFNSKSSFNSIFKKFKGLTPSQFQKSL